ncbi:MAG: sulfatase-like hydrolase/transferase, partial [Planctomycetaceae bacterium]
LCDRDDGEIDGFELADAAGVWWTARARIDGTTVVVTADGVSAPTAVRYGWAAHPECDLVNAAGMPASPFRVTLRAPADGGVSVGRRPTASGRRPDRPNVLVIYSDDHGWADLGVQGIDPNVRTPHLDRLARDGVRFTRGYVSAPQCVPSRAGLLTGRYQQRFGVEDNNHGPLPLGERTIAELLAPAGYTSGWVGKCHLDIGGSKRTGEGYRLLNDHMPQHQGFSDYFRGEINHFFASHDPSGRPFPDAPRRVTDGRCRIEVQTEAALSFLDRRAGSPGDPWFLYLAWYAPHVPLESPEPWFSQTPESLPTKRRQALAMIAAMDDGLGRIRERLRTMGVAEDTLIFFVGDNGAPLGSVWNGSSNGPLAGQKGMVAEGGVRTPFVAAWPGTWPAGTTCDHPVINLDVAATAVAAAGLAPDVTLDGVDLSPFVTGRDANAPHERLFWRWESQAAVLEMPYKLIMLGGHPPMLFDVTDPAGEHHDRDLSDRHPEIVSRLRAKLELWAADLEPPGLPTSSSGTRHHERLFIEHHLATFDGPPPNQVVLEGPATASVSARRPNIVLFLVDDMGWMDSSPYGSQYHRTPNIARLARQGMRFTRAYAQPLCSPTRASLLTGKNAARHGITSAVGHLPPTEGSLPESAPPNQAMIYPESRTFLDPVEYTLAEALRDAGYHTGHFGKWHLGLSSPHWPEAHGFDVAFHCHPDPGPPGGYFSPYGVVAPGSETAKGRRAVVGTITDGPPGEYITDRLTDEAIRFIEGHVRESRTSGDRPFFLNLWHFGVHGPWGHKESLTGILTDRKDPSGRQDNLVMASMIESIDESLGRLLDTLDRLEISDETIVVFTSDNGGNTHSNTVGDAKTNKRNDQSPAASSYRKWAGHRPPTNNAPLRDGKGRLYEGGVRVPLIVRFTGLIEPGTTSDALVGCTDVYPTLLELAGLSADPAQVKDGISYAGVLRGTAARGRDSYVIWFPGRPHGAVAYVDDWKLIRREEPSPQGDGAMRELYNLADDLGEEKNLADRYPGKVRELDDVIERLLADAGTLTPRPNPDFRGHHSTTERNANR